MTDRSDVLVPDATHEGGSVPQLETVAERLARLERQLSMKPDPTALEEELAERVMTKLNERLGQYPQLPPGPVPPGYTYPASSSTFANMLTAAALASSTSGGFSGGLRAWLAALGEYPLMVRMYFDSRYRLSRVAQFGVPTILAFMVFNYLFFTQLFITIWIISPTLERLILIVLAVALYKVLSREAARYAEVLNYLAKYNPGKPS